MKKLTCLFMLSLCFLKAAAPISRTFTVEQFQYLLSNAIHLNNNALSGKTEKAKTLGIKPFLHQTLLSDPNPIKKRYKIVRNLLTFGPADADFSCLESTSWPLEATMAFMAHLSAQSLRPRLNQVLATGFPKGPVGNPSGMFMASGTHTLEGLKQCFDFYEWYRLNSNYHILFKVDNSLAIRAAATLVNASVYLRLLGGSEKRPGYYDQQSLPVLLQAQAMAPDFLHVYYQLHGLYTRLGLKAEADRWYAEGNSRCQRMAHKELKEYVETDSRANLIKLEKADFNIKNSEELLIALKYCLQRSDLTELKRFTYLGLLIKKSPNPREKIQALEIAIKLLTESLLMELLQNKQTSTLSTMLSIEDKTCSAYMVLKRRVTEALIELDDLKLAMSWADCLKLPEALDTILDRYRQSTGGDETTKVVLCDLKALEEGSETELLRLLQSVKNPANALSLEELDGKGLRDLRARLKGFEEAGLGAGDSAYDKTVLKIREREGKLYQHHLEKQRAEREDLRRSRAAEQPVGPAGTTYGGVARAAHRRGPATFHDDAASSTAFVEASSSSDEDGVNVGVVRKEGKRYAQVPLTAEEQIRFDSLVIQFEEAEGCRIKAILYDGGGELHSFTFHGEHGETASSLLADRKAWYKRLCFERYKLCKD